MTEILLVDNKSQIYWLNFTSIEHEFEYEYDATNKAVGGITICAILIVNIPLLAYIFKNGQGTFMNKLIALDCFICIREVSR